MKDREYLEATSVFKLLSDNILTQFPQHLCFDRVSRPWSHFLDGVDLAVGEVSAVEAFEIGVERPIHMGRGAFRRTFKKAFEPCPVIGVS